jgi:hypothetical protein
MRVDDIDARTEQVDTEHVFGFNEGADIGSKGECRQRGISTDRAEQPRRRQRSISRNSNGTKPSYGSGLDFEPKFDLPSQGDREMHEVDLSNVLIGAGCFSVLTGMLQLFCQALEVRPAKRGRVSTGLNFGKWSLRSTAPGFIMIAIGVLLLGSLSVQ